MISSHAKISEVSNLLFRLADARARSDKLFAIVKTDSLYERPIPERHRIIFYVGHLEAFDWNLFLPVISSLTPFAPELDKLFAFGIDPVDGGLPMDVPGDWPPLTKVQEYVGRIRLNIDEALKRFDDTRTSNKSQPELARLLNVAIEHRLMHAETLAYMLHQLPFAKKHYQAQRHTSQTPVPNELVVIPEGHTRLGLRKSDSRFGWDNEYDACDLEVPSFAIDKYMVSNEDFLGFILDQGYQNSHLWSAEDWRWKEQQSIGQPVFWEKNGEAWFYRGMFENIPLPLAWPVYVSHAEASAYARWAHKALPTEPQWQRAAYGTSNAPDHEFPWGDDNPSPGEGNFDFARWDPVDVHSFPQNRSAFGVVGQLGNGWEWTSTLFAPLPGFEPFSFYPGYSANFFDGHHFVMKGGSARTAACMLRSSFRNWFQPHYQYVYAGFRCVS